MRAVDWILLAVCGGLLLAGPSMALQEWTRHTEQTGLGGLTGEAPPLDPAFRTAWRSGLLLGVIIAGIAGTVVAVRVSRQPKVRAVSGRLIAILLVGMTVLDLAFIMDGRWFINAPYAVRAASIVWLYPIAAILMGGSTMRLTELEDAFGDPHD